MDKSMLAGLESLPEADQQRTVSMMEQVQICDRIRNCLSQLYAKDITLDDKQELDEALQPKIQAAFQTDEIRRTPPTPQDEMRAGMSYFHKTIWMGMPKFLRRLNTALKNIGINERVPYNAPLIQFSSWMCGDRDGNQKVTPEVTKDVCLLARK
ncbi:phosphoenolpyruvate carboxylase 2-like [Arachis hypogaea]|uniref:phosphoenolpyruvate carboxylase 2-like n=1 Tax=Arachis hypogaea TaxID=3818 RepID=UPI000DEDAAB9|nr:phosphoenolpyruvate carboxylase 2-like [Arachis hypogaea]